MSEFAIIICFSLFLSFTEKKPLRRISAKKRRSEEEKKTMKFKYRHLLACYLYLHLMRKHRNEAVDVFMTFHTW